MPEAQGQGRGEEEARLDDAEDLKAAERALRQRAVRLLAAREHSSQELRQKLSTRTDHPELADRVVASLRAANLVSDDRFVEEFVRARIERGHGPIRIRADLRGRGVDEDLIETNLTRPGTFWARRLRQVREKKFGPGLPADRADWARQARFLAQRGYPADIIYQVLRADPD